MVKEWVLRRASTKKSRASKAMGNQARVAQAPNKGKRISPKRNRATIPKVVMEGSK